MRAEFSFLVVASHQRAPKKVRGGEHAYFQSDVHHGLRRTEQGHHHNVNATLFTPHPLTLKLFVVMSVACEDSPAVAVLLSSFKEVSQSDRQTDRQTGANTPTGWRCVVANMCGIEC